MLPKREGVEKEFLLSVQRLKKESWWFENTYYREAHAIWGYNLEAILLGKKKIERKGEVILEIIYEVKNEQMGNLGSYFETEKQQIRSYI